MLIKLFDLGICLFEGYMYFSFWNNFLKLRNSKKWFPIAVMGIAMVTLFGVNQLHIAGANLTAAVILSIIACQILFVDEGTKKLFYIIVSNLVLLCSEFIIMALFNLPLGNYTINYNDDISRMVLMILSTKLLAFLVFRLLCHFANNGKTIFFPLLIPYFCVFPVACLLMYIGLTYSSISFKDSFAGAIVLFGCILLLAANIILFFIYDKMTFTMNCVKEYELTDIKRKLENQHYLQVEEINKKHSRIIHDMNNYLNTIKTLAAEESNEEIVGIINSLNNHIVHIEEEHYCSNQILNAILNGKKQEAYLSEIEYSVYVEPGFEKPDVEDIDLISIMSNLIDNAIEAASKCKKGMVDIQFYKANDGRFTTIKITNTYDEIPLKKAGEFITKKKNPSMHGIGLRQVRTLVEKYGGWLNIEYDNFIFSVTIMFA